MFISDISDMITFILKEYDLLIWKFWSMRVIYQKINCKNVHFVTFFILSVTDMGLLAET